MGLVRPSGLFLESAALPPEPLSRRRACRHACPRCQNLSITDQDLWAKLILPKDANSMTSPIYRRWLIARIFPSVSLNQAVFAPPAVIMPFLIVIPGMSYSSNFTPRALSSATSASTSSTCQNAWLAFDVPALGVGYMNTPVRPHR